MFKMCLTFCTSLVYLLCVASLILLDVQNLIREKLYFLPPPDYYAASVNSCLRRLGTSCPFHLRG